MKIDQNIKLAVDAVVFGYKNGSLDLLLIKRKYPAFEQSWALPGGFVRDNESLQEAVLRELQEETGIKVNYLEQLEAFGEIGRDPRARVVTIAFIALINPSNYALHASTDALDAAWYSLEELPKLAFDHPKIISTALEMLRRKIHYEPIGFELLAPKFPFSDLEKLYESIANKKIDRRNFRKKILSFEILTQCGIAKQEGSGRPATLFKFNKEKYERLKADGFHFEIKFA